MRTLWAHIHIVKEQIRARMLAISDNAPQVDKEFTEKAIYDEGQDNLRPFRDAVKRIPKAPNPCYCDAFEKQFTVTDVVESKGNVSRLTVLSRRIRSGIGTC